MQKAILFLAYYNAHVAKLVECCNTYKVTYPLHILHILILITFTNIKYCVILVNYSYFYHHGENCCICHLSKE